MDTFKFWEKQFQAGACLPLSWLLMASSLHRAAMIIWEQVEQDRKTQLDPEKLAQSDNIPRLTPVFMFLAGLTIETLVKGILVSQESALDNNGKFKFNKHNLVGLLEQASITLSHDERDLVGRLEQYIKWAGRYPVPLKTSDFVPRSWPSGEIAPLPQITDSDGPAIFALMEKLKNELEQIIDRNREIKRT